MMGIFDIFDTFDVLGTSLPKVPVTLRPLIPYVGGKLPKNKKKRNIRLRQMAIERGFLNVPKRVTEAQWGERQSDGTSVQYGQPGDYICQSKSDPTDVWIVAKKIFESTYSFVG